MKTDFKNVCQDTGLTEDCGVFAAYDFDGGDVASVIYYGLFALQHRGQESCGIAVSDTNGPQDSLKDEKDLGLLTEVFNAEKLEKLKGNLGLGHVSYPSEGGRKRENAQPLVLNYVKGTLGISNNGSLTNAKELRDDLSYKGAIFQTTVDSELIGYLIARERINTPSVEAAVLAACRQLKGCAGLFHAVGKGGNGKPDSAQALGDCLQQDVLGSDCRVNLVKVREAQALLPVAGHDDHRCGGGTACIGTALAQLFHNGPVGHHIEFPGHLVPGAGGLHGSLEHGLNLLFLNRPVLELTDAYSFKNLFHSYLLCMYRILFCREQFLKGNCQGFFCVALPS